MSRRIDKEEAAHLQYETEHTEPPKSRSVVIYMAVLIAAAFLLLLLAYFMQLRTASTVEGLHQSVNSFQTIDQLVDDNRALQEEVAQLKEEREALQSELASFKSSLADAEGEAQANLNAARLSEAERDALNALNQLRTLYNDHSYKDAQNLLSSWSSSGMTLEEALTSVSSSLSKEERSVYDPLASYQRIAKLLGF